MDLFIDSALYEEIEEIHTWGILSGVTTNPSLIYRSKENFEEIIQKIAALVDGPVSAEVPSDTAEKMVVDARKLACLDKNIVIKLPMTEEGIKATSILTREKIQVNMTLIFSPNQALLASQAGAQYVSPFIGRIDDISYDGADLIKNIKKIFTQGNMPTKIIAASIRHPKHVLDAAINGADIATIPYKVFKQMLKHPLTDSGLEGFNKDWNKYLKGDTK